MAVCTWAVLCDYAFLDAQGKTCLIGIFDRITTRGVPSVHGQAALVLRLRGEPNESVRVRVEVIRPTGAPQGRMEQEVQLTPQGESAVQLNIVGLPLPDFGRYAFSIAVNDETQQTIEFQVVPLTTNAPH
jgi:hypothetical protein